MTIVQQHTEALLRELALSAIDADGGAPMRLGVDFGELDRQLRAALQAGETTADLVLPVTARSPGEVRAAGEALASGDQLAADGQLLCPPASPEIADGRRWLVEQTADQLDGAAPTAWQPAQPATPGPTSDLDHAEVLSQLPHTVVVGDAANRIAYASAAAAELLGWEPDELVGQRITAIVPERLHHAHIVGYTRYLLTGQPRLLGTPMHVPARRRDGSEIDVELSLSVLTDRAGRPLFAAVLHPLPRGEAPPPIVGVETWHDTLHRELRAALDATATQPAPMRRQRLLAALAGAVGWDLAAWWAVDGDRLRCEELWRRSGELEPFEAATRERRFPPGRGLPGRVWQRRDAPAWLTDIARDANFPRAAAALAVGLRSGCATPVAAGGETVGVVELLTTRVQPADEALLVALGTAGELLGEAAADHPAGADST
jgi:PAS domain S-box-containing protein